MDDSWKFLDIKKSKSRFTEVKDQSYKDELITLTGAPKDARDFLFWVNEGEMRWGLTMKPAPCPGESPCWAKASLTGRIGGSSLKPSKESQSLLNGVEDSIFNRILEIYKKQL